MSAFGQIITDDQVEDAVISVLKRWTNEYMAEIERQVGVEVGYHQRPPGDGSYLVRTDFDKWPEEMLPIVLVVSPGVADDPVREGRGVYRAKWEIGVVCIVESTDQVSTRRYAYRMGAALRAALVQHQTLERALNSSVRGVDWVGHRNNEVPLGPEDNRTIWANRQLFEVEVGGVLTRGGGPGPGVDPREDPTPPLAEPPLVATHTVTPEPFDGQ